MPHDPHVAPHAEQHPDAWHRHTHDEGAPQVEHGARVRPLTLSVAFGVMGVLFIITCLVIIVYFNKYATENRARRLETTVLAEGADGSFARRANDLASLEEFTWIDQQTGEVAVPITQAIDQVVTQYQQSASARR